jgi:hypothetical protein
MLRRFILVLAIAIAVGTAASLSGYAFASGQRNDHARGFRADDRMKGGHSGGGSHRGACDNLVGGTFVWPYCAYCTRHPGDRNC